MLTSTDRMVDLRACHFASAGPSKVPRSERQTVPSRCRFGFMSAIPPFVPLNTTIGGSSGYRGPAAKSNLDRGVHPLLVLCRQK